MNVTAVVRVPNRYRLTERARERERKREYMGIYIDTNTHIYSSLWYLFPNSWLVSLVHSHFSFFFPFFFLLILFFAASALPLFSCNCTHTPSALPLFFCRLLWVSKLFFFCHLLSGFHFLLFFGSYQHCH